MKAELYDVLIVTLPAVTQLVFPCSIMTLCYYGIILYFISSDESGATIYLTPHIREQSLGIFLTGQSHLELPPGRVSWTVAGECTESCTKKKMGDQSVFITSAYLHMHYLGKKRATSSEITVAAVLLIAIIFLCERVSISFN